MTKKYVLTSKDGEMKVEAFGFTGSECEEKMEFLVRALGDEIASELKAEYHMGPEVEEEKICFKPHCG
jgi:hypothetical protein